MKISGPLFFGMAQQFIEVMSFTRKKPEVLVLCMRLVPTIDATGLEALETVCPPCTGSRDTDSPLWSKSEGMGNNA